MGTTVKTIYDAQIATLKSLFPQLNERVQIYDGRFEVSDIDEVTISPPEMFVTNLGGSTTSPSFNIVDHDDSWVVIIAAKQTGLADNENETAPHLATELCLSLQRQLWGLDVEVIGMPENIKSVPVNQNRDGIFLWAVTWDQTFRTGTGSGIGIDLGNS